MKTSRRIFVERMAQVLALLGFSSWPLSANTTKSESKMLIHQVYFWLKNPEDSNAHQKLQAGLKKLLTVDTIDSGHIGVPASTEARDVVDHSYAFSYQVRFKSMADHDSYQQDPVHLQFIEECSHLWGRVQVYDCNPI